MIGNMDKKWVSYDFLDSLKKQMNKSLLTVEHLLPFKIELKKMSMPDGSSDDEYNFRGWELQKDGVRYLISDRYGDKDIDIKEVLPVLPKNVIEVGAKGVVYSHVRTPRSMRLRELQSMTFREFVNMLAPLDHSNPVHYKLSVMDSIASTFFRYNSRKCSNPGFGKDSNVEIHNAIIGKCGAVESPTLAKIEERASLLRWLVINEVVDIGVGEWRTIQQFLLASAAHKTSITKHSRAHGGVKEVIDLSNLSLSLFYNDITCYEDPKKYFDFVTKGAVKDRFPAIRMHGIFTEDFNKLGTGNPEEYAKEHVEEFKSLAYNYTYYKANIAKHVHGYSNNKLVDVQGRNLTNLGKLLMVIDAYCESQEEFDSWVRVLNACIKDYEDMLVYPSLLQDLFGKMGVPKTTRESMKTIEDEMLWLKDKGFDFTKQTWFNREYEYSYNYCIQVTNLNTFTAKNLKIRQYKQEDAIKINDSNVWGDRS